MKWAHVEESSHLLWRLGATEGVRAARSRAQVLMSTPVPKVRATDRRKMPKKRAQPSAKVVEKSTKVTKGAKVKKGNSEVLKKTTAAKGNAKRGPSKRAKKPLPKSPSKSPNASVKNPGLSLSLDHLADTGLLSPDISPDFGSREPTAEIEHPRVLLEQSNGQITFVNSADLVSDKTHVSCFESGPVEFTISLPNGSERYIASTPYKKDGSKKNPSETYDPMMELNRVIQMMAEAIPDENDRKPLFVHSAAMDAAVELKAMGPFLAAVDQLNAYFVSLRPQLSLPSPLPFPLVHELLNATYLRTVSPHAGQLRKYRSFSNEVYGELLPDFVSKLFREVGLKKDDVFIDLGSGVANCTLQAALEVGCESWGCEFMPLPADLAEKQKKEIEARLKMWGIPHGSINVIEGDFAKSPEVPRVMRRSKVVLANNLMFDHKLNAALHNLFLDLPDGAKIISLRPFVPPRYAINAKNAHAATSILQSKTKVFGPGSVNWAPMGGNYYIATVDRGPLRRWFEAEAAKPARVRQGRSTVSPDPTPQPSQSDVVDIKPPVQPAVQPQALATS